MHCCFEADFNYLLDKLNIRKNITVPHDIQINDVNFLAWTKNLSQSMKIELFNIYRSDFELFGYDPFDFIGHFDNSVG